MSICYTSLETAQTEFQQTVAISKLFHDAFECVIGDEISNIAVEGVETLGNIFVTLEKQFKQLILDGDTDEFKCYKSAVVF